MMSLRRRLVVTAAGVLSAAFILMGLALVFAFDRAVRAHTYSELEDRVDGLVRSLRIENDGTFRLIRNPGDPRFEKIAGGLYWQIGSGNKVELKSRSLANTPLAWSEVPPRLGARRSSIIPGPDSQELLAYESNLAFDAPTGQVEVRFMMAINDAELLDARAGFLEAIVPSMLLIVLLLLASLAAFIRYGLARSTRCKARLPMCEPAAVRAYPAISRSRSCRSSMRRMQLFPLGHRISLPRALARVIWPTRSRRHLRCLMCMSGSCAGMGNPNWRTRSLRK